MKKLIIFSVLIATVLFGCKSQQKSTGYTYDDVYSTRSDNAKIAAKPKIQNEDLSVANLPRLRRFKNGLNGLFGEVVRDYDLNFDLGKQINLILISTVKLGVSLLPAVPAHFEDCHAFHADIMEGILDRIKS